MFRRSLQYLKFVITSERGNVSIETFSDITETVSDPEGADDGSWDSLEEEVQDDQSGEEEEKESGLEEDDSSQVDLLDPNEGERDPEAKAEDKEKDETDKEGDGDGDKPGQEEVPRETTPAPVGKTLKARLNGESLEIPEEAEILVPVDGKKERVSISELKANFAGKVAWGKKFTELGANKKEFETERNAYLSEKSEIVQTLTKARTMIADSLQNKGDPREAINFVVDVMGIDSYDFNMALMNHMAEEVMSLNDMTEIERTAYWARKENDYLKNKQESLAKSRQSDQAKSDNRQQIDQLRQTHGVSEEAFTQAFEELQGLGVKEVTAEQVIERAVMTPLVTKAIDLVSPYEDELTTEEFDTLAADLARIMRTHPDTPVEVIQKRLEEEFKVSKLVDVVESKKTKSQPEKAKVEDSKVETFETFDDLY